MYDLQIQIEKINNLNVKNINEKKLSLENLIIKYQNEKSQKNKLQILYLIHYTIHKYNELQYFYDE